MTCAEFKELAAALALDALDPDERARARAHLAEPIGHEGCAEALGRAEQAARLLPGALIDRPPPDRVWRWIEARLSARAPPLPYHPVGIGFYAARAEYLDLLIWRGLEKFRPRGGPKVRIRLPPAESQQTFGSVRDFRAS